MAEEIIRVYHLTRMQSLNAAQLNFDNQGLLLLNIALAIIMFGVALGISLDDFKQLALHPKAVILGFISQFILLPLLTFLLVLIVKPEPSIALGMILVAACPGGNISNFMTHLANGNTALSVSLTALASVLALIMVPLNFQFYASQYMPTAELLKEVSLNPKDLFEILILILAVPLVLGMWLRSKKRVLAINISNLLKPISIVLFLVFVIIAFSKNIDVFKNYIHHVLALGILHNLSALALGYFLARIFTLSRKDTKTITIETGIQNSGLGLVLVFTFFDGLGGMAIMVAFWGIWHIISGLSLALFWAKK